MIASMAAIALPRPLAPHCSPSTPSAVASSISFDAIAASSVGAGSSTPPPISNRHIPSCPTGPRPLSWSRPSSPSSESELPRQASILYPPFSFARIEYRGFTLYEIDASRVAAAIDYAARQPLPDPSLVFPWLHGLHPQNQIQQTFFLTRRRGLRKTPLCLRGVTLVKADGDLAMSRLKGAIAPDEFLDSSSMASEFIDIDPREGFSVRNFQIQTAKTAMTSDIIIYGDDVEKALDVARNVAEAQQRRRLRHSADDHELPEYNTFICIDPFDKFEENHAEIVAVDSTGTNTGEIVDFFYQERREMYTMTKATEISHNVWIGPSPDPSLEEEQQFDILIECSDLGHLNPSALRAVHETPGNYANRLFFDFPSSGSISPPTWSQADADEILDTCKWIYHLSNGTKPSHPSSSSTWADPGKEDESAIRPSIELSGHRPRKVLVHCPDGYTESTLLAIAYYSYSTGLPVPDAWLSLHTAMKRNFFAYVTDVVLLRSICARLLKALLRLLKRQRMNRVGCRLLTGRSLVEFWTICILETSTTRTIPSCSAQWALVRY
jgi:dual specificity MAP kinase phosphatase